MKTKKSFLNFITDVIPLIIIAFLGLYKSKLLIFSLANEVVGLYQLYSQLLGYVTIFDFGVTSALLYRYFLPLKEKDQQKINTVFSTGMRTFLIIGLLIITSSIIFSFIIPLLIKDNPFTYSYILMTFLMYILTNVIYYFIVSYKLLLDAEEKKYINNIIIESFNVIKSILEIICLLVFKNLLSILIVGIITSLISSIMIVIICKKNNPDLKYVKEKDKSLFGDVKALLIHKIAYLVNSNVDMLLITKFMGLGKVVIYSTYNYITNMLNKIITKIYVSIVPSLGNLLLEDKKKAQNIFFELNSFIYFIAIIITATLTFSISQFINLWYEGEIYTSYLLGFNFSIVLFENITIQPLLAYTDAGGVFKKTQKSAIIVAVLNLSLSLILINFFGINGVLIATFLSHLIADNIVKARIICEELLACSPKQYYYDLLCFFGLLGFVILIEYFLLKGFICTSIFMWFVVSVLLFVINFVVIVICFKLLKKLTFTKRIINLFKRKK